MSALNGRLSSRVIEVIKKQLIQPNGFSPDLGCAQWPRALMQPAEGRAIFMPIASQRCHRTGYDSSR